MPDIYTILAKHFSKEASLQEEKLVEAFKLDNSQEYTALRKYWLNQKPEVNKFNTEAAWQKVASAAQQGDAKPAANWLKWALFAILLLLLGLALKTVCWNAEPAEQIQRAAIDSIQSIELEDGSIIHLNKQATLYYPEKFSTTSREVKIEGEAFFEIAKDPNRPFCITTEHSTVEVLGTSFNINTNDLSTVVDVATGKVKVRALNSEEMVYLTPNQSAFVSDQELKKYETLDQNYLAWKTGILNFDNLPISEVVATINQYRENGIKLSKSDSDCHFSGSISHNNLEEITEILKLSCKLNLTLKNGNYELH